MDLAVNEDKIKYDYQITLDNYIFFKSRNLFMEISHKNLKHGRAVLSSFLLTPLG